MTLAQAIETVRIALGDRNEHHSLCNSRKQMPMRDENWPCDCYASRRQLPHKAMDMIEDFIREKRAKEKPPARRQYRAGDPDRGQ